MATDSELEGFRLNWFTSRFLCELPILPTDRLDVTCDEILFARTNTTWSSSLVRYSEGPCFYNRNRLSSNPGLNQLNRHPDESRHRGPPMPDADLRRRPDDLMRRQLEVAKNSPNESPFGMVNGFSEAFVLIDWLLLEQIEAWHCRWHGK